jgi:hypothetical protein
MKVVIQIAIIILILIIQAAVQLYIAERWRSYILAYIVGAISLLLIGITTVITIMM